MLFASGLQAIFVRYFSFGKPVFSQLSGTPTTLTLWYPKTGGGGMERLTAKVHFKPDGKFDFVEPIEGNPPAGFVFAARATQNVRIAVVSDGMALAVQQAKNLADGYARASGKVGVCLVTSGPGATNTVTGIATAYMDSIPLVVITGQVPTHLIGNDAFQEADIVGITRSCTKHNYLVKNVAELAATIKQAFYIARTGRPGPVLIDLPKNVITASTEFSYPETIHIRSYNPNYNPNRKQLRKAAELIAQAERPAIYAGGGVISSDSAAELVRLAELCQCPVTTTLMGLGAFPGDHPLWLGMLGMHGTYTANMAKRILLMMLSLKRYTS